MSTNRRAFRPMMIAVTLLASVSVAGQAPSSAGKTAGAGKTSKSWTPPRTAWGDPDLQGFWPGTEFVGVPLQRADAFGTRNELTDEEFAARSAQFAKQIARAKTKLAKALGAVIHAL